MRFPRFSIRRLLLLTGLVAVLLYVLFTRPMTLAKSYIYKLQHAAPAEITKSLDYVSMDTDGAYTEGKLVERSWADVFICRQTFVISLVRPDSEKPRLEEVENHYCTSTPFGVSQQEAYVYLEVREKR